MDRVTDSERSPSHAGASGDPVRRGPVGRWLIEGRQLSVNGTFWCALLGFLILTVSWALYNPLMATPDEPAHVQKAASVVRGQIFDADVVDDRTIEIPEYFMDVSLLSCYAFKWDNTANCDLTMMKMDRRPDGQAEGPNPAALYNPVYYLIVGWPTFLPHSLADLYLMRGLSAALASFFLALGMRSLRQANVRPIAVIGASAMVSPMVVFLCGSVNPQAMELSAAFALWCQLLSIIRAPDDKRLTSRMWWLALTTVVFVNSRGLSPLFLGLIIIGAVALQPWRRTWAVLRDRRSWAPVGVGVVGSFAAVAWIVGIGSLGGDGSAADPTMTFEYVVKRTLMSTDDYIRQSIGVFGWLDTPLPWWTVVMFAAGFLIVMFLCWSVGSWRERLVVFGTGVVFCIALPCVLHGLQAKNLGWMWQARYILPVLIGVPMLAGFVLHDRMPTWRLGERALVASWASVFSFVHVYALVFNLHRYVNGYTGPWLHLIDDAWTPPHLPLWGSIALPLVGCLILSFALVRMTRTTSSIELQIKAS